MPTLSLCVGFGYESTPQAQHRHAADKCPRNDGLWLVDVATGAPLELPTCVLFLCAILLVDRCCMPIVVQLCPNLCDAACISRMSVCGGLSGGVHGIDA